MVRGPRPAARHRLRVQRGRVRPPARPAQRLAARRRARPEPRVRHRPLRVERRGLGGRRRPGARHLRAARRHVHRGRHAALRDRAPRRPGDPRRRPGRAHARGPLQRCARVGLRRRRDVRGARAVRRAGRAAGVRRRRARAWPGRVPGRGAQPHGPVRQLPEHVRPVLHGRAPDPVGLGPAPGGRGVRGGAPLGVRQRAALVPRLPRGRPAPGRRARPHRPVRPARAGAAVRRGGGAVHRAGPPAVPDRRVGPQRRGQRDADEPGRLGHDRPVGRRRAPRRARAGHGRAARLLRRLRHARRSCARP